MAPTGRARPTARDLRHFHDGPRGGVPRSAVVERYPSLADHRVPASERPLFRTAKRADPASGT